MNTLLRPNDTLQDGDEYQQNDGTWKPVPPDKIGAPLSASGYGKVLRTGNPIILEPTPLPVADAPTPPLAALTKYDPPPPVSLWGPSETLIEWSPSTVIPTWMGRNGLFNAKGVYLTRMGDLIRITPRGMRGVGNCHIEFPMSAIPKVIEWLDKQK